MNIFLYCGFDNKKEWEQSIKKTLKGNKIFLLKDNPDFTKIDIAIIWNIPNQILKKLTNLKIIFSLGAGVDHILKLTGYNNTPIIRVKDPSMGFRMSNHVLSQILQYQLNLKFFQQAQIDNSWKENLQFQRKVKSNNQITIGMLGVGFLGNNIGKFLKKLEYNVFGFRNTLKKSKISFPIYKKNNLDYFIKSSDIIVSVLPSTPETHDFIDLNFLKKMKNNSLLINVGRGASINEKHLLSHLKKNKNFFASLDVFKEEPLKKNNLLWKMKNITITPHVASLTDVEKISQQIFNRIKNFKKDKKIKSDVNLKKGY